MTVGIIAIKETQLDRQPEIFEAFNYIDLQQDMQFDSWDNANAYLFDHYFDASEKETAIRGFGRNAEWTIIIDPEMVDILESDTLIALSRKLDSVIFTFLIQTTSNSFGFTKFDGEIKRDFFATGGDVTENLGLPLPEEEGLNINQKVFADDIIALANKLGIDPEKPIDQPYIVKQLAYNDEMKAKLAQYATQQRSAKPDKPWWKIW